MSAEQEDENPKSLNNDLTKVAAHIIKSADAGGKLFKVVDGVKQCEPVDEVLLSGGCILSSTVQGYVDRLKDAFVASDVTKANEKYYFYATLICALGPKIQARIPSSEEAFKKKPSTTGTPAQTLTTQMWEQFASALYSVLRGEEAWYWDDMNDKLRSYVGHYLYLHMEKFNVLRANRESMTRDQVEVHNNNVNLFITSIVTTQLLVPILTEILRVTERLDEKLPQAFGKTWKEAEKKTWAQLLTLEETAITKMLGTIFVFLLSKDGDTFNLTYALCGALVDWTGGQSWEGDNFRGPLLREAGKLVKSKEYRKDQFNEFFRKKVIQKMQIPRKKESSLDPSPEDQTAPLFHYGQKNGGPQKKNWNNNRQNRRKGQLASWNTKESKEKVGRNKRKAGPVKFCKECDQNGEHPRVVHSHSAENCSRYPKRRRKNNKSPKAQPQNSSSQINLDDFTDKMTTLASLMTSFIEMQKTALDKNTNKDESQ